MKIELLVYFLIAAFVYTFYVSIGNIETGVRKSISQSEKTTARVESVELKVTMVGDDVNEIKEILKQNGLWRKRR